MRPLLLLPILALLGGCSTLDKVLENRVSCTLDRKQALYSSMYGPIGITSKVSEGDSTTICGGAASSATKL